MPKKNVQGFESWSVQRLRRNVELLDKCVLRFASWGAGCDAKSCALCLEYLRTRSRCRYCPIAADGHPECEHTPYERAAMRNAEAMVYSGNFQPDWLTPDDCAAEIRYLLRLRGKLAKALEAKG